MIRSRSFRFFVLCLLALPLAGCIKLPKDKVRKQYYALEATLDVSPLAGGPSLGVLQVQRPDISPAYKGRSLVYRIGENRYESDYYNEYFAAPEDMVLWDAVRWFGECGKFELVTPGRAALAPDFILSGLINAMYFDFSETGGPQAVLETQWLLTRSNSADGRKTIARNLKIRIPAGSRSPEAMIGALNQCLSRTYNELIAEFTKL